MRKHLLLLSFCSGAIVFSAPAYAQQAENFAYSITDATGQTNLWAQLRVLDLRTGTYSGTLINGMAEKQVAFDAFTKKQIAPNAAVNKMGFNEHPAFSSGVAALALDSRNNRLYYTPMFIDQLRYIDLKTMNVYYVTLPFTGKPLKASDQGNIVTRMVIASDGYGYAMTNDATQLIRFSTGKKPVITDLGTIVDDQANNNISIHNSCSSYGGDMIADDDGNLYVFSARNNIFKISIASKVATHLGVVSGLPAGFTINGAAVGADNKIVVASAMESASLFTVDTKSWAASPVKVSGTIWHTSDLATANLLVSGNKKSTEVVDMRNKPTVTNEISGRVSIFPNPVTENQFVIRFGQLEAGAYTVQVTDAMGRQVLQQQVNTSGENHVQKIQLAPSAAKGVYMVKVLDANNKAAYSSKIVVQ